jgi:hypothetical protein
MASRQLCRGAEQFAFEGYRRHACIAGVGQYQRRYHQVSASWRKDLRVPADVGS